ncbi:MAG: hypothetical protein H0T92_21455, partial [Pyrinomonadaceae bacterium]|nr:hypothetical protein [Pyrinomonadaceae bacterium]
MQPDDTNSLHTDCTLAARIKLYYDLDVPVRLPCPLLIALHGYSGNKRQMIREAKQLAPDGFAVASLQGFYQHLREPKRAGEPLRYGFGWLTNFHPEESIALHHQTLLDHTDLLIAEGVTLKGQIFLLGFSQSVALNYRFVFTNPQTVHGVVAICGGGLPGDWDTNELYSDTETAVLHLCGSRDEFYPPARTSDYAARLRTRTQDVQVRSYDVGHEITPAMREYARAWLQPRAVA